MAFVIKEQVTSKNLKKGDFVTKGHGAPFYKVHEVGQHVRISKVNETMILGVPSDVFDGDSWCRAEHVEDYVPVTIMRRKVLSTNILSEGYDRGSQTLELQFSGGVYRYSMVPVEIYDKFLKAESKGKFFFSNIKGKYGDKKVS